MSSRAQKLLRLQALEDDLREKMTRYKQIQAALGESPALRAAQAAVTEAERLHEQVRRAQSMLEAELKALDAKHKEESAKLYSGSVKHHKDVEHLQHEVESLQRRRGQLDERALQGMDEVEQARLALEGANGALATAQAEWRGTQGDLVTEEQKLKRYIAARRRERDAALAEIPPEDLKVFRTLQERKGGRAVAPLRDGGCGVCGVNVSATKVNQVRSYDELVRCGNCERILAR